MTVNRIADGAVTVNKIADDAVIDVHLADGAVTDVKIADNAVNNVHLVNGAVTDVKIADNAVHNVHLANGAVTEGKIADDTITEGKVATGAVVKSINNKTDDVMLAAGTNVTISEAENTLTISATGGSGGDAWSLSGNAGTTPTTQFLGTTDNKALNLKVNNLRVLLLQPLSASPNLIGGFQDNFADTDVAGATIGGGGTSGFANVITDNYGTIGGGIANQAGNASTSITDATHATVGGGRDNAAGGMHSTVGGGQNNQVSGDNATIAGGRGNIAIGEYATIAGGYSNFATGDSATVGGGYENNANIDSATVAGGSSNGATGYTATVGGGYLNTASGGYSTVGGGLLNTASGDQSTVGGGAGNIASGDYSAIPGGYQNTATGAYTLAVGTHASANHTGTFVWGDGSTEAEVASTHDNQFLVRASGGTWFYSDPELTSGVRLSGGSSALSTVSDRNMKRNIREVDGKEILTKLAQIPISQWSYKAQDPSIEHIGPMAQDFYAAFSLGEDDKHINTLDPDGVALAAIQGLYELAKEKDAEIADQQEQIAAQQERISTLEGRLAALEALVSSQSSP